MNLRQSDGRRKRHGWGRFRPPQNSPDFKSIAHFADSNGDVFRVALAGNPNAGKTTIFNALTGQHQHVGNYPGVTVDKKVGIRNYQGVLVEFVDLPGAYSLSAYSLEEVVARDFVLKDKPDLIVDVIDSTNLKRNLYMLLQLQELGVPVIGVLNMSDEALEKGIEINADVLGALIGIPFVKTVGNRGKGVDDLLQLIAKIAQGKISILGRTLNYGIIIEPERKRLAALIKEDEKFSQKYFVDWVAVKLLEEDEDATNKIRREHDNPDEVLDMAALFREKISRHFNEDSSVAIGEQRYAFIHGITRQAVKTVPTEEDKFNLTDKIDKVVLNRFGGVFIFLFLMFLVYQFTFSIGNPLSDIIDQFFAYAGTILGKVLPAGIIRDLIVDGVIGGVGGVLVFFPLVMMLFLSLSFLEDTGYMARAAFVMDKFFQIFGLHGRSFIPFMIATGCAVPAVMSARTLSNKRDRTITILVLPIMICGAKSPVIAMLAAAFFPSKAGLIFWLLWFSSWLLAVTFALILTKVMFKGQTAPFVMELPPYRFPTWRGVFNHMWHKSAAYLKKAGTIILAASIVLWFLLSFPKLEVDNSDNSTASGKAQLTHSFAGRIGKAIEPALEPAGFDWRIGIGIFSGFAAKEVIISTLGIVYEIEDADPSIESSPKGTPLKETLANDPKYSPAMALAMMVFVMIYIPCMSVLAVVKKELGSWSWVLFQVVYTSVIAWALAVGVYQFGLLVGLG